jgi:hypothetical protein
MIRLHTVVESLKAKSADDKVREFKPGETLWCDLQQSGEAFNFETDRHAEWLVDREIFERCCVLTKATPNKPS